MHRARGNGEAAEPVQPQIVDNERRPLDRPAQLRPQRGEEARERAIRHGAEHGDAVAGERLHAPNPFEEACCNLFTPRRRPRASRGGSAPDAARLPPRARGAARAGSRLRPRPPRRTTHRSTRAACPQLRRPATSRDRQNCARRCARRADACPAPRRDRRWQLRPGSPSPSQLSASVLPCARQPAAATARWRRSSGGGVPASRQMRPSGRAACQPPDEAATIAASSAASLTPSCSASLPHRCHAARLADGPADPRDIEDQRLRPRHKPARAQFAEVVIEPLRSIVAAREDHRVRWSNAPVAQSSTIEKAQRGNLLSSHCSARGKPRSIFQPSGPA